MHQDNHQSPMAVAYAQALLDLANEAGTLEETGDELRDLRQIVEASPQFAQVLADPAIGPEERAALLRRLFEGRASKLILDFLLLMNEKGRLGLLAGIAGAFDDLVDQQMGKVEVDVTVPERLNQQQLDAVAVKVSQALKRQAVVHQYIDPSIIGGLILRVQDQLIDGSVRAQLTAMRRRLLASRPI